MTRPRNAKRAPGASEPSQAEPRTSPPEDLILSAYFGPEVSKDDLANAIAILGLEGQAFGGDLPTELDAAVAEVLLAVKRDYLPQWAVVRNSEVTRGRRKTNLRPSLAYQPQLLFTINWADSGPGFSWPMAYYATEVPAHDAVVVTASADCPDAYGFTDFAIGSFKRGEDIVAGAMTVIVDNWRRQAQDGQGRWAYLFDEGLVDDAVANACADEVEQWREEDVDEDQF